jgi:cytochrome P450
VRDASHSDIVDRVSVATTTKSTHPAGRPLPNAAPHPVFGDLLEVRRDGLFEVAAQRFSELGEIFELRLGFLRLVFLTRPEHIHHVATTRQESYPKGRSVDSLKMLVGNGLFTADGDEWKHNRSLLQPKFRKAAILKYGPLMMEACEELHSSWEARVGQAVDISDEMMNLALSIIGRTMFSRLVSEEEDTIGQAYREALGEVSRRSEQFVELPLWVPTTSHRKFNAAKEFIDGYIKKAITERRQKEARYDDLLDALLDASRNGGMSEQQLMDEVSTVFLAGHETTALALTWAWHLLGRHPEVDAALHAELVTVLGDRHPTIDDLPNLPYTRMVSEETLRICPPVWVYPRTALEDDVIDGYRIPKDAFVLICPYFAHRRPEAWPSPERFDPERFRATGRRPAHEFCPFGAGARTCAGLSFAMQEMMLALATLARTFRPEPRAGYVPKLTAKGTLRPDGGMPMVLRKR